MWKKVLKSKWKYIKKNYLTKTECLIFSRFFVWFSLHFFLFCLVGTLPYEFKIVIAGNHELTFDKEFMADLVKQDYYRFPSVSKLKPEDFDNVQSLLTNSIYLQDSEVTVKGFRIYGAPWWVTFWILLSAAQITVLPVCLAEYCY